MLIALFPNERKTHSFELAKQIGKFLFKKGVNITADDDKASSIGALPLSEVDPSEIQFLISMGGDGTLLRIAHRFSDLGVPILGINLGYLGFLADIRVEDVFSSLEDLLNGQYKIEEHLMLEAISPEGTILHAANDIVIHRANNYSLIKLSMHLEGTYVNTFIADGIIISTPNGSTAYSLAAGGPILSPLVDAIVITPICPHTVSNRPIVLTPDQEIEIEYLSPYDPVDVRADGLNAFLLSSQQKMKIRRSSRPFQLVHLKNHEYFFTLRTKLGWSGKLR